MKQYLQMLRLIYEDGVFKHPTRVETGPTVNPTRGMANLHFSHDLDCDGFPLVTTRRVPWESCMGELRTFVLGQ